MVRSRWVWLAPAGALAYCALALWPTLVDYGRFAPLVLAAAGLIVALVGGALLLVAVAVRRRRPSRAVVALALAAGVQAATPVYVGWDDGCNEHSGEIAAIAVPYVVLAEPETSYAPYGDAQTLMACL